MTSGWPARARSGVGLLLVGFLLLGCSPGAVDPTPRSASSSAPVQVPPTAAPQELRAAQLRRKPNIVLLMTDDQTLSDMSVMARTRRLIGHRGATFRRAFSSYPLCCPARTTVLTGQQAHNHGVMGNEAPWGGFTKFRGDAETLPVWLSGVGYRTSMIGKYLNAYPAPGGSTYVPPGWSNWLVPVEGTYDYYDQVVNENGVLRAHHEYQTSWVTRQAVDVVRAGASSRRPFFLWASFLAPHFGLPVESDDPRAFDPDATDTPAVPEKYRDFYAARRLPHPSSLNEKNLRDKAPFMSRAEAKPVADLREAYQQRLEALRSVDDAVGRIVRVLRATGQLRNTYLFFVSDNGFMVGQHRRFMKVLGYEESIRIPLLIRGPGIPAGSVVRQQVTLADLSATLSAVARAAPTRRADGVSLLRMVGHPHVLRDRPVLLEAGGWPFPRRQRLYVGVRTAENRVLLRWFDGTEELYDLRSDPFELHGRVSRREHPWLRPMRRELRVVRSCVAATCRNPP